VWDAAGNHPSQMEKWHRLFKKLYTKLSSYRLMEVLNNNVHYFFGVPLTRKLIEEAVRKTLIDMDVQKSF
jgi:hypothetical protein